MKRLITPGALLLLAILSTSCKEDPAKVEQSNKQKAEIAKLKGELLIAEEKLKNLPPDVSAELAEAKQTSEKQTAEIAALESEITTLEARKRSLQSEFDTYKVKYQIK